MPRQRGVDLEQRTRPPAITTVPARKATPVDENAATLNYDAAAQRLGIGVRTVKKLVADGSLRHIRVGRTVLFRPVDLDAFLEAHARGGIPSKPRKAT